MIASKLDSLRLSRGPGSRALAWALQTRPGLHWLELPLAYVRYRVAGEGARTVVFVADPPNVIEHYDCLIELLTPDFRVVCLDMPGFGFSFPKQSYSYSVDDLAQVIAELLDRLGHGRYVLAFSCGAALSAVSIAAQRRDLVDRVINIQAGSWNEQARWARRIDWMGMVGTPFLGQLLLASAPGWMARKWYEIALPKPVDTEKFAQTGLDALNHGACFCLASGLQQLRSTAPALDSVDVPSMVIWGTADRTHRRTDKGSSRSYFPDALWHEFSTAGHFPELEEPERFAGLLREFVGTG